MNQPRTLSTFRRAARRISDLVADRSRATRGLAAVLAMTACSLALAAEKKITAEFKPSVFDATRATFVNTTPQSVFCVHFRGRCPEEVFSLYLPIDHVAYDALLPNASDADSMSFRFPSEFVEIPVVNKVNGHSATVRFRVSHFAMRYQTDFDAGSHDSLWVGGNWVYTPPAPCGSAFNDALWTSHHFHVMWSTPPAAKTQACVKKPTRVIPAQAILLHNLGIGYELVTPDPLSMTNGTYVGKKTFTIGPNGDFDLGNRSRPSDRIINMNFELTVKHDFQLHMADDNRRAVLEPPSGWKSWLSGGIPPPVLKRDLGFSMSIGAPFTVALSCASANAGRCNLANPAGSRAPYSVLLSIPGVADNAGNPVSRLEITTDQAARLKPSRGYVNDAQSRLHVEAGSASVQEMLKHPGTRYDDVLTLTFDAQTN